jgi:CRP-like cAMP-binding protein
MNNLRNETSAPENIQALEDSKVICLPYETIQFLYARFTSINVFARKLLEKYYADAETRNFISRMPNAHKRYEWFLELYPHLANRVPLKYIASFLGITLETLSRIRSKKKTILP